MIHELRKLEELLFKVKRLNQNCKKFYILWKYFYSLTPIFVLSTKCINPWVLEFMVSNTKGNSQWENCISWFKWTTKSTEIRTPQVIMISQYYILSSSGTPWVFYYNIIHFHFYHHRLHFISWLSTVHGVYLLCSFSVISIYIIF
jgi:hypothetical protein